MSQSPLPEPAGFNQLSKAEQISYVQMLWDKIAAYPNDVDVPESHWQVLQDRLADYQSNPNKVAPARDVLERLANKQQK